MSHNLPLCDQSRSFSVRALPVPIVIMNLCSKSFNLLLINQSPTMDVTVTVDLAQERPSLTDCQHLVIQYLERRRK